MDVGLELTVPDAAVAPFGDGWMVSPCPTGGSSQAAKAATQQPGRITASNEVAGTTPIGTEVVALICESPPATEGAGRTRQYVQLVRPDDGRPLLSFTVTPAVITVANEQLPDVPRFDTTIVHAGRLTIPYADQPDLPPDYACLCNWRFSVAPPDMLPRSTPEDIIRAARSDGTGGTITALFGLYGGPRWSGDAAPTTTGSDTGLPAWMVVHQPILFVPSCPASSSEINGLKLVGGCGPTISWSLKVITDGDTQPLVDQAGGGYLPSIQ